MIRLHFLNVGHGDCTLVEFPSGRTMMVDINNAPALDDETEQELSSHLKLTPELSLIYYLQGKSPFAEKGYDIELTDPVDYYKRLYGKNEIFRFVCTHPDMDHISGLHRLHVEEEIPIGNFWDPDHSFEKSEADFEGTKFDYRDWLAYKKLRDTSLDYPKTLNLDRGASAQFYADDGIHILASTKALRDLAHEKEDSNMLSYVLMIIHGKQKIVLGGDATSEVWQDICENYTESGLKATVLKASHHGRDSGYHQQAVKAMSPEYTIVSVGSKPETDASNKYRKYSPNVWSTRWKGNIVLDCHEDGRIEANCQYDR